MSTDGFFAIGQDTFHRTVGLSITEAAAFLVLARGSGPDNVTTSWSSKAVADRMGTRWSTAKTAITNLSTAKLVKISGTKKRPSYKLVKKGTDIWLPNSLVDGVKARPSPVERVRQSQDPMRLRLLVDLYSDQNLPEHGGIATNVVFGKYVRTRLGEYRQFVIWGFDTGSITAYRTGTVVPHSRDTTDDELAAGRHWSADAFFERFSTLQRLGIVERVPMLYESETGEPIHPMHKTSRIQLEASLAEACEGAGIRALSWEHHEIFDQKGWPDIVAIVPAHIERVTLIGTYRLVYRPQTAMTGAWWRHMLERSPELIRDFEAIAAEASSSAQSL